MSDFPRLPELLCPAGSPEALDAAIEGGADAIYLGGETFNARMNAHNFGGDALRSAVLRAHAFGVKVYLTLNTLCYDRETTAFLDAAAEAWKIGVDALIIADLGGAAAIRRAMPSFELHASTQMSGHNAPMARELQRMGYSRMVAAREISAKDLAVLTRESPIEIELFVHGALCVCHSGQCLFSSMVGGRSGNRGECAQPCRLPYGCAGKSGKSCYPLSLKDLSLAPEMTEIIRSGVASLKIEGRMKSPEYVRDTARVYRRLLDECRAATKEEMRGLSETFSRGGFTDGYYRGRMGSEMLGVRSESDKQNSRAIEPFAGLTRRIPLQAEATLRAGEPMTLSLSDGKRRTTVTGIAPEPARNAPLTAETVTRNLSKLGGTIYTLENLNLRLDGNVMAPISSLNDLRRRGIAQWEEEGRGIPRPTPSPYAPIRPKETRVARRVARFQSFDQVTAEAREYFDRILLPLHRLPPSEDDLRAVDGVILPPVIFDSDLPRVREMLIRAKNFGIPTAVCGNLGQLELIREVGMTPVGDYRLNLCNGESVAVLETLGVAESMLSPELTLPQARDVGGNTSLLVYGRIPLMTLEKCVIREIADCNLCKTGKVALRDRRGVEFPVLREWEHRNIVYNSLPTSASDRQDALLRANLCAWEFFFTTETAGEVDRVIDAFRKGAPIGREVRRI